MLRRFPDSPGCTVLLIRVILWIFLAKYSNNQELPTRDTDYAFGINQKNLFYDNNRIPDGIEVSPYLFANATRKFFFLVGSKIERLEITITPCASPITWVVTFKQNRASTEQYDFGNHEESSEVGFQPFNNIDTLYTLSGEVAETLRIDAPSEGVYSVDITSIKTDSYVQIFSTTSPDVDTFPELPADKRVREVDKSGSSFTVAWNASPDERHFGDDIEYYVSVNTKRSYKTLCSVLSHLNGDPKPTLPPNSGFGFSTDQFKKRFLRQKAKPIPAAKRGSIFLQSVGRERKLTFKKVKSGSGYYVDVYVKNKVNGKSRQYSGIFIKTKRKTRQYPKLKEGKIKNISFTPRKKKFIFFFKVKKSTKDVHLAISNCVGTTLVELTSKNGTFHKSRIKYSQILTFNDLNPGVYNVALLKSVSRRHTVYISLTSKISAQKMPVLPIDTTVKVFDYLTTCNSVTVAWMGTDKKQKYCLYKTELTSLKDNSTSISKKLNQCDAFDRHQNGAQKITCKKFRYRKKEQSVLAITVTGLKPDTSYIFDVFVNKGNYFAFPYNSVRTKTSTECYLPT